jgi:hypothetical protein
MDITWLAGINEAADAKRRGHRRQPARGERYGAVMLHDGFTASVACGQGRVNGVASGNGLI